MAVCRAVTVRVHITHAAAAGTRRGLGGIIEAGVMAVGRAVTVRVHITDTAAACARSGFGRIVGAGIIDIRHTIAVSVGQYGDRIILHLTVRSKTSDRQAAGRAKDLEDLKYLTRLREQLKNE